jgi:uncharacterized membrane protein YgcG
MTISLILALMMQLVVATKAGLVNYSQGMTNVKSAQLIAAGAPIKTAPDGYVEVLLTPGSYLRMAGNSEVVLDNVDLAEVAVRIVTGIVNVEVVDINREFPINVTTGNLKLQIADPGIYRFGDGVATIIEGQLQTVDPRVTYKKGWQLAYTTTIRAQRISDLELTALDTFSKKRSELIASANMALAPVLQQSGYTNNSPFWLYSPSVGLYTFIPFGNRRSPYGFRYRGVEPPYVGVGRNMNSNGGDGGGGRTGAASSSGGNSSSGSFNSAGERTFSTPSGGSKSPGEYSGSKNPPARPTP